ncbi:MAG: alkaline phosphatase family protein [Kofleriaceae bacterium]
MAFLITHSVLDVKIVPVATTAAKNQYKVNQSGKFDLLFPGELHYGAKATLQYTTKKPPDTGDDAGGGRGTTPLHGGNTTTQDSIPLTMVLHDPSGAVWTKPTVTVEDMAKWRDLRGSLGQWSYTVTGTSKAYDMENGATLHVVQDVEQALTGMSMQVVETVPVSSAQPLVNTQLVGGQQTFQFDLHQVGNFVATVTNFHGTMQLVDPDNVVVSSSTLGAIRQAITLPMLARSRTMTGIVRKWSLKVEGTTSVPLLGHPKVNATVLGEGRISTKALTDRLLWLLGPHGQRVHIQGENAGGKILLNLTTDLAAVETLDMLQLVPARIPGDPPLGASTKIPVFSTSDTMVKYGQTFTLDISSLKVTSIDIGFGPSSNKPNAAVFKITVGTSGGIAIGWKGASLATATPTNNRLYVEFGLQPDADGIMRLVTWCSDSPMNVDFTESTVLAVIAAIALNPVLGSVSAAVLHHEITASANGTITDTVQNKSDYKKDPLDSNKTIITDTGARDMMMLMGGHFIYHPPTFQGTDVLFEHVAPMEPDPHASFGYVSGLGSRGDTWAVPNLKSKIDHIVVVMMENRSYDHFLGYRTERDGWTPALKARVPDARPMSQAAFSPNSLGLRTAIPVPVGHSLADVTEQLSRNKESPDGINDPAFFEKNFQKQLTAHQLSADGNDGTVAKDVLGYYGPTELPMTGFLAQNFAFSDTYYASHPGPTLPNRMLSLTGDVQHDRYNTPILDNNSGDNFVLSRAQTIYDVLQREGVSFKVFESAPSVTMLRMFARYATDTTNIGTVDEFKALMKEKTTTKAPKPSVMVVEPAMHHAPENDDHPIAGGTSTRVDVYRGQTFLQDIYDALEQSDIWDRTLLLITYDEHGGFYDHVIPPLAETLHVNKPPVVVVHPDPTHATSVAKVAPGAVATHVPSRADVKELGGNPGLDIKYGVRVPMFVVSPMVPATADGSLGGSVPKPVLDHCSILKTILARFCGDRRPFLSDRVAAANTFENFVTATAPAQHLPKPNFPPLPDNDIQRTIAPSSKIVTPILTRERERTEQVDFHDLSGRLARLLGR